MDPCELLDWRLRFRGVGWGYAATVPSVMYSMVHADGMCVHTDVCGMCVCKSQRTENARLKSLEKGIHTVQV